MNSEKSRDVLALLRSLTLAAASGAASGAEVEPAAPEVPLAAFFAIRAELYLVLVCFKSGPRCVRL